MAPSHKAITVPAMKIAYGVMGYGRGHASRVTAVLPALMRDHEVTVFAGGEAYDFLATRFPTVRIPTLGYVYGRHDGRQLGYSLLATLRNNIPLLTELATETGSFRYVVEAFRRLQIELVISDSEAWTLRAGQRLGLPRIGFDHIGVLAWCRQQLPPELWLAGQRDALAYRALMGVPERLLVSSFYPAPPKSANTRVIGPVLRESVQYAQPQDHGHLLVYLNRGTRQYQPHIHAALRTLNRPVIIYGAGHTGTEGNVEFRPIDGTAFVRDLSQCHAVMATSGNQLISEALHLGKPILALPEDAFEQQLNAWMVERMDVGARAGLTSLKGDDIQRFLDLHGHYCANLASIPPEPPDTAAEILRGYIRELRGTRSRPPLKPIGRLARLLV
ncbi:MAG: hypothetical protein EPN72_13140 [Nevskiaceae bacterium]|nr:MAG: hypothetical protein EPN63_02735 [Nevskiaceae bacterium]TBR71644.1 MAG: hypothetical protein EPN72_13140 [Nevskiaceae bacterium]